MRKGRYGEQIVPRQRTRSLAVVHLGLFQIYRSGDGHEKTEQQKMTDVM